MSDEETARRYVLFMRELISDYPDGFDFSEESKRVVEDRVGCAMNRSVVGWLKEDMVERTDGLWVMWRTVMTDEARRRLIEHAKEILRQCHGLIFHLNIDDLYYWARPDIRHLLTGVDFRRYFKKFIVSDKYYVSGNEMIVSDFLAKDASEVDFDRYFRAEPEVVQSQSAVSSCDDCKSEYDEKLSELLKVEFPNGLRPNSRIDQNKVRRTYAECYGADIPENVDLGRILPRLGVIHDGKVFPKPIQGETGWRKIVDGLIASGYKIFSYSRLMELHSPEMMSVGIVSDEMLREVIEQDSGNDFWTGIKYFSCAGYPLSVEKAIQGVLSENQILVAEKDLLRRLWYANPADVHSVLASDGKFFWNSPECYAIPDRVEFDEHEASASVDYVCREIDKRGYFSLAQLNFADSAALNDSNLTTTVIRKVFFYRYLSGEFDIHGQIVCRHGAAIDGRYPLRDFYRSHSELSIDQIYSEAKEYNIVGDMALLAAHEELVRVDSDLFVSPGMVLFEVDATDKELSLQCLGPVSTLGAVDLDRLPAVPGYPWNRFLLEGYLRRSSKRFALLTPSTASREPAGVLVRREDGIDNPVVAFAIAAVDAGVAAEANEVGEFLVSTRCALRRGASLIEQVVSKMRDIYERKR